MTCIFVLHCAGCFSADHLHENGAVIGIQDGAEDDSRKHWTVCSQPVLSNINLHSKITARNLSEQIFRRYFLKPRIELWLLCKNVDNEQTATLISCYPSWRNWLRRQSVRCTCITVFTVVNTTSAVLIQDGGDEEVVKLFINTSVLVLLGFFNHVQSR